MARIPQPSLLIWNQIDAASDLNRLRLVFDAIPDEPLMQTLEQKRGNGRDEYPIRATWNSMLAGVVYQHPSVASLRRELCRNAELRQECGFDPWLGEAAVPTDSAFSNFLEAVLRHENEIRAMFHLLVDELGANLGDLGKFLAIDGKPHKNAEASTDASIGIKSGRPRASTSVPWLILHSPKRIAAPVQQNTEPGDPVPAAGPQTSPNVQRRLHSGVFHSGTDKFLPFIRKHFLSARVAVRTSDVGNSVADQSLD